MSPTSSHGAGASASRSDASLTGVLSLLTSEATVAEADGEGAAGALDGATETGTAPSVAGDVSATGVGVGVVGGAEASGDDGEFWDVGSARSGFGEVAARVLSPLRTG